MSDTRARMMDATMAVVRAEGIGAVSARAIAREGGFSQALVFYHFDSVEDLLVAATDIGSRELVASWAPRLAEVATLSDLVDLAEELHSSEQEAGNVVVLAEFLAASVHRPALSRASGLALDRWVGALLPTIERLIAGSPVVDLMAPDELAGLIADAFVGIELAAVTRADDALARRFDALRVVAHLIDAMVDLGPMSTRAIRGWVRRKGLPGTA